MKNQDSTWFKGISQPFFGYSFLLFISCVCLVGCGESNAYIPTQDGTVAPSTDRPIGSFRVTYYWVVNEKHYKKAKERQVLTMNGKLISWVSKRFKKDLDMEGTGILLNGKTVNYAGMKNGGVRYKYTPSRWGLGVGTCKLLPYRSVAVDPRIIPLGTKVYIPQAKGMKLPDGTIHDGIFRAEDVGQAIKQKKMDFFAAEGASSGNLYNKHGIRSMKQITAYHYADPVPGGCHEMESRDILRASTLLDMFGIK